MKHLFLSVALAATIAVSASAQHFELGSAWVAGEGVYIITQDTDTNRVLVGASVNGADPKHAWVDREFGDNYTVICDVRMDSWIDAEDLSRAGIAGNIQPNLDGNDRGINMLFHDTLGNVEFLNDLRAWGDDTAFPWEVGVWYTFELTMTNGDTVGGKIYPTADGPDSADAVTLADWAFPDPQDRQGGFVGVTASTNPGLMASFDNFTVVVGGETVFEDDFEGTDPAPNTVGLSGAWTGGLAGYYVVDGGQLYAIATNGADPKHAWFNEEIEGAAGISADMTMLTWADAEDLSRAGLAVHIQPNLDGSDRGINLLFHDSLGNVEFLNDLRAWADDTAFPWEVGTPYTLSLSSDGATVVGSVLDPASGESAELAPWAFPDPQDRQNGFAGVTASTLRGLIAAYDNVEITDGAGNVLYSDDFETFFSSSNNWEVYE